VDGKNEFRRAGAFINKRYRKLSRGMQAIELKKNNISLNTLILNPDATETIVTVHGMFGNLSQFYMTIAPELSKDFRIILYDLRSHGKSTRHETGYDLQSLSDDIRCLLDALNINKCHVLGFSYGTLIALKFAMLFKERVKKVVALEIPPKSILPQILKGAYGFNDFLVFAYTLPPLVHKNFMRSKRQLENNFKMYEYIYNNTSFVDDMNRDGEFKEEDYNLIDAPVQLLFGKESACIPELNRVYHWIRNHEITLMEGGHNFFSERSIETSIKIKNFLFKPDTSFNHN
jgi:esterase